MHDQVLSLRHNEKREERGRNVTPPRESGGAHVSAERGHYLQSCRRVRDNGAELMGRWRESPLERMGGVNEIFLK